MKNIENPNDKIKKVKENELNNLNNTRGPVPDLINTSSRTKNDIFSDEYKKGLEFFSQGKYRISY